LKAVVLAAGLGTRLRPYTLFVPKPMLPLGERPVLEHLFEWLKSNKILELNVCVGYLRRTIEEYFRDGEDLGLHIKYIRTGRPMGTAGQLKSAQNYVKNTFVCIYGDSVLDFDLTKLIKAHKKNKALVTMALMSYKTHLKYGFIDVDSQGRVKKWNEKPEVAGLINIGCYIMEPKFLEYIPDKKMYGMDITFNKIMKKGELIQGIKVEGTFVDIGDKKSYASAYKSYVERLGKIL